MEVLHRRLDVGVAHPFLDSTDVGDADHSRAKCVAEVVEAERAERGALESCAVALGECGAVEVAACEADEDEIVVAGPVVPLAQVGEGLADLGRHRD